MKNPFVSVIIPNYNHAQFLDERIQSVLNQTYQNFELIILDDKSTDNSLEVINQYKDNPHVSHIVVNDENSGSTFKQWHKGFDLAKGELIWIAESDDSCDNSLLETLISGYVEDNAVIAFCRSIKYDIHGNRSIYTHQSVLPRDIVAPGKEFISNYMIDRNSIANASSAIFSRSVAVAIDKQYMSMRGNGDWLFWIELLECGNVFFCTKELNFFRFHNTNTTKTLCRQGVSAIEHKTIFDYLKNHGYISHSEIRILKLRYLYDYMKSDYPSRSSRIKVLKVWDKYYVGRFHIVLSAIKGNFMQIFDNIMLLFRNI